MSKKKQQVYLLLMIFAVNAIVTFADLPGDTMLWGEVQNACHAPAFGILAVAVLGLLKGSPLARHLGPLAIYVSAFAVAIAAGVATEIVQHFSGRDAEVVDVLRDALGAAASLLLCFSIFSKRPPYQPYFKDWNSLGSLLAALLLLAAAFYSLGYTAVAYARRDCALPVLIDFDSSWSRRFCILENAAFGVVQEPADGTLLLPTRIARLTLEAAEYPGLTIEEPYPDWTAFDTLRFELISTRPDTVTLGLRIDDSHHDYDFVDRFNYALSVHPGINSIHIPLEQVRLAPDGRQTDMRAIRRIIIFAHQPVKPIEVYLSHFWLE